MVNGGDVNVNGDGVVDGDGGGDYLYAQQKARQSLMT